MLVCQKVVYETSGIFDLVAAIDKIHGNLKVQSGDRAAGIQQYFLQPCPLPFIGSIFCASTIYFCSSRKGHLPRRSGEHIGKVIGTIPSDHHTKAAGIQSFTETTGGGRESKRQEPGQWSAVSIPTYKQLPRNIAFRIGSSGEKYCTFVLVSSLR